VFAREATLHAMIAKIYELPYCDVDRMNYTKRKESMDRSTGSIPKLLLKCP